MRQENGTSVAPPSADSMAQALEEYLEAAAAGTAPPRDEFLARYPELAEELDACLVALRFIGRAAAGPHSVVAEIADAQPPGTLGDFRIVREVGRGGMGVVYEAEQISLGRRVALKVLPFAATLDPRQLQRFHNEARAAAALDHPHIVHVHAVGCERAVHFYAMQFIEGQTLAALIADLRRRGGRPADDGEQPTTPHVPKAALSVADTAPRAAASTERSPLDRDHFRRVAEWGIQAAEALDHGHTLSIVHRDVKPANLLLDGRSNLWVTDFGLAHIQSDARLTMTGDLVGTLRYMSPEQALAKRAVVDHRTDVYSLGATLYELLTLEPAFGGDDRQELLRQIAFEEPKPPRRLNRAIPAELETIVLEALEKNPADRYATARELADDLERFLKDEPIRARRPVLRQRVGRWCRRHPSVLASALVTLVLAVVALTVSNLRIAHANYLKDVALEEKEMALDAAQQSDAETRAVLAFVEEKIFAAARPKGLKGGLGKNVPLRQALEAALPYVGERFAGQPLTEARLRRTLGLSFRYLGDDDIAAAQFQAARTLYAKHCGPDHPDTLASMNNLANSFAALGRQDQALELRKETLRLRQAKLGPNAPDTLASLSNLANSYEALGEQRVALELREETLWRRRAGLGPNHPATLESVNNLAISYTLVGRHQEAVGLREEALAIQKTRFRPGDPHLLPFMHNLAESYHSLGRHAEARTLYEETLELAKANLGPNHGNTLLVMNNLAWLLATAADDRFRDPERAVGLAARAARFAPKKADFWGTLGTAGYRRGDWKQAALHLEKAISLRSPEDVRNAKESFFLAMAHWQLGDPPGARRWFDKGGAWMEQGPSRQDEERRFRAEAAALLGIKD